MKKLIFGLAAASSAVLMNGEALAQPQPNECAVAYEEANPGYIAPELQSAVDEYASHGVDIHVQILEDGEDEGITREGNSGYQQAIEYREDLTIRCGWSNENTINVVLSQHPRVYEIFRDGSVDTSTVTDAVENDKDSFIADLRDFDTPFQEDIAQMLTDISPFRQHNEASNESSDSKPLEFPDIPWGSVGIGTAVLVAAGGVGSRAYKGRSLRLVRDDLLDEPDEIGEELSSVLLDVFSTLDKLPKDDALQLRELNRKLSPLLTSFDDTKKAVDGIYRKERFSIWPDVYGLEGKSQPIFDLVEETRDGLDLLTRELNEVKGRIYNIDRQVADFQTLIDTTSNEADSLTADGWKLDDLQGLDDYRNVLAEVKKLRQAQYVDKPGDLVSNNMPLLESLLSDIKDLPGRLERNSQDIGTRQNALRELPQEVATVNNALKGLKSNYHAECSEDIASLDGDIAKLVVNLEKIAKSLGEIKGVKSAGRVSESEQLLSDYDATEAQIKEHFNTIKDRVSSLQNIASGIDSSLSSNRSAVEATVAEANSAGDDIEPDTRESILALNDSLEEFATNELGSDKPRLLTIDRWFNEFGTKVSDLQARARDEKAEMDSLRQLIPDLSHNIEQRYNDLQDYIQRERSDIGESVESAASSFDMPGEPKLGDRKQMRKTQEKLENALREIENIRSEAERDVRRAEDERRRERERQEAEARRRREEEEAARRRRNNSYGSGSGFGSGGFGGGGFGGFGGSSGGGGGGSSSGGGW